MKVSGASIGSRSFAALPAARPVGYRDDAIGHRALLVSSELNNLPTIEIEILNLQINDRQAPFAEHPRVMDLDIRHDVAGRHSEARVVFGDVRQGAVHRALG